MGKSATRLTAIAVTAAAAGATVAALRAGRRTRQSLPVTRGAGRATMRGVTINRPPEAVYRFFRDLPRLAAALEPSPRVTEVDDRRSRWEAGGPTETAVAYTVEILSDELEKVLAWQVTDGPVPHEGEIEFALAPADRGTEVRVSLRYRQRGGRLAATAARVTGDEPDQVLRTSLRRIKQVLECGEVPVSDDEPAAQGPIRAKVTRLVRERLAAGGRP